MSEPSGSGEDPGDPPAPPGSSGPPGSPGPPPLSRLDPDHAAGRRAADPPPGPPPSRQVIDTRPYRWMIGIFGLALVIAISIYQLATHGVGTTGITPGHELHYFAAPLARTDLNGDPNLSPPCTLDRHNPRALNVCLLAQRGPLVLSFFVTGSDQCERQIGALQTLSHRFRASDVQFAAVAIDASHKSVAALVRSRRWTIPVAYDRDGSVGALYGVAVCPMAELSYRGGIVKARLIGDRWQTAAELAPQVRALVADQRRRPPS